MDSMMPDPIPLHPASIAQIQAQIDHLEAAHKAKGYPLSSRIVHLCHHLPVEITRVLPAPPTPQSPHPNAESTDPESSPAGVLRGTSFVGAGILSPPRAPEFKESDCLTLSSTATEGGVGKWKMQGRRGHTAMISGMRSLSSTHEQIVVAWTGDIMQEQESSHPPVPTVKPKPPSPTNEPPIPTPHPVHITEKEDPSPQPLQIGEQQQVYLPELTSVEKQDLEKELANFSAYEEEHEGRGKLTYVPVFVGKEEAKGHYEGYCKTTLWPLFHYLLWLDSPSDLPTPDPAWLHYKATNLLFAKRAAEIYRPGDIIIVHDYHLLLVPKMLRDCIGTNIHNGLGAPGGNGNGVVGNGIESKEFGEVAIGMFIHTPWPSSEVFRCLPKRKEILEGMVGANMVCFQTYSYSRHFTSTCIRVCGFESTPGGIDVNGQVTAVGYCPIGVDVDRVLADRDRPGVKPKMEALRDLYKGKKIIVGREKLDVAKGVYNKLQAFEKFLQVYPEWRSKVVLIQVTTPALSESPNLETKVAELVSHINGTYGSLDFTPVHHYHQAIERDEYFALLSVADLALITSLRDGMNTSSMEYILCQDQTAKSPIVLSEFMGTAASFTSALQINPHDLLGVANAINQGLTMSEEEKLSRHDELLDSVKSHTSQTWAKTLVRQLLENVGGDHQAHQTPVLDKNALSKAFKAAKKRLIMFDYDGTLTPIVKVPSQAIPTEQTKKAIATLASDPDNVVFLISGRDGDFLEEHWGDVANLGLSAEHGSFVKIPGETEWQNMTETLDMSWMTEVEEIFKYYTERTTGSTIETKRASVTWHYRNADPTFGLFQSHQCLDLLESNLVPRRPIEVLVGKKNLEVRPASISKSEIVKRLVYQNPEVEFVICAGDDKTDEDMFRALRGIFPPGGVTHDGTPNLMAPPLAVTSGLTEEEANDLPDVELTLKPEEVWAVAVGPASKKTLAKWHVTSPEELLEAVLKMIG